MATLRTKDLRNYMTSNLDVSSYTRMSRKNTDTVRDMVSFSLKVLAKVGLFAQKLHGCSRNFLQLLACSHSR